MEHKIFGPVPSRRLGMSLGVNNIPHKICTYSCVYCQIGKAIRMQVNRQEFFKPEELAEEVKQILDKIKMNNEYPDYITIVPDGEPTLDANLGELIKQLKKTGIPVAVITNGSLLFIPEVRGDLLQADFVSVKADTFEINNWRKIDKPHKKLNLDEIMNGTVLFSKEFEGKFVTETMLIKGINDAEKKLANTADHIATYNPDIAYIAIPTRPPAYKEVIPADERSVNKAYHIFKEKISEVELLTGYEGNAFSSTGNFSDDILSITAVHPMREDAVKIMMHNKNINKNMLDKLISENLIEKLEYGGYAYYLRKFKR